MTTASDIAFWEILKDKVLRSHLHHLTIQFILPWHGLKHSAPVLSCCLFLVSMPVCFLVLSRTRNSTEDHIPTRVALQALVTIIVPTCSLWPNRYVELASVLHPYINIPFEVIFKDTINGVIEFRNPGNDLASLIGSGTTVNRHTIRINIGWKWWVRYFKWWMLVESESGRTLGLSNQLHRNVLTANSDPMDLSPRPFALTSSTLCLLHPLDCFPHGEIPTLDADRKVTLEFTAFSPSLRTLSTAQIVSAIPFMISERPRRRPRPLVSVLKQLSASYGSDMVIDSLLNVSVDYEHALHHLYESLSGEQRIREAWVEILGIKAWRRERFLVALEAALVRRGWIERWAVQLTVK